MTYDFSVIASVLYVHCKGQTISKANYGVLNSPKKCIFQYVHKIIPTFVFWENWGHYKFISRFTDLSYALTFVQNILYKQLHISSFQNHIKCSKKHFTKICQLWIMLPVHFMNSTSSVFWESNVILRLTLIKWPEPCNKYIIFVQSLENIM